MKRFFPIVLLLGCAAAFVLGIVYLFELRFESGDVFPPYSSLRADPLGTMALYESLGRIPGLAVSRDFNDSDTLPQEEPHTLYLHLGGEPFEFEWMPDETYQSVKDFMTRGGRLVITFYPQTEDLWSDEVNHKNEKMTRSKTDKKDQDSGTNSDHWTPLNDKWGFHTGFEKLEPAPDGDTYPPAAVYNQTDLALPDTLDWHSGIIFTNLAHEWRVIYARDGNAVVIEREFGRGSAVIASDSYLVSNEAMFKDRHADLLAWVVGSAKNVVFDEAHFGIVQSPGVAALMRKYRLQGLAAGLILLAALFIWKHSFGLVPPLADEPGERFVAGKDSAAGFVNLLRRCVAPRDLLATCFGEWKKSVTRNGKHFTARFQRAETIYTDTGPAGGNPVETYKKIAESLGTQNQKL
ncbi:MAG TPA: DUF4350 domain-containing protein [Verrucomicrobiae bacterium]